MRDTNLLLAGALGLIAAVTLPAQSALPAIEMTAGSSRVIDCPSDLLRISTSDPAVVDTVAASKREVLLQAKGPGQATVGVWSKDGQRAFYTVAVGPDLEPIRKLVRQAFPGEGIELHGVKDALALTGRASSQLVAERAAALLAPFAKGVVNNLTVAPPLVEKQVLLRVRFAELNRTAGSSFGGSLISTGGGNTIGRVTTGDYSGSQPDKISSTEAKFSITDALNIFAFRPDLNLAAFIQALRTQGVLQMLAEPNLVTTNGKEASFLVGGEYPVPVVQGGSASNSISIVFKEFGIRLTFKPEITGNNTIRMHVKPEVSALDPANGVTLSGFTIPALATRRMETDVELAEGQSFAIAGLLDDRLTETLSKMPGLASIPLLGHLFKSRTGEKAQTELVVIVTPTVTDPIEAAKALPEPYMLKEFLGASGTASKPADRR
jgi:pilus assembly protein CpaC